MRNYRHLRVWQDAHALTLRIYQVTRSFPREETFAFTNQMRRASYSIGNNLAEGSVASPAEFARYVQIAMGSASELDYQVLLARDLGYLPPGAANDIEAAVTSIRKMLTALHIRLKPRRTSCEET